MANAVYGYVTDRIMEQLRQGVIPWRQPWTFAVNYVSRKPYRGINRLLLPKSGEYLTFNQLKERGGSIRKGATAHMVVFFKKMEPETVETMDSATGEIVTLTDAISLDRAVLRYYKVFHIDDVEGIESKMPPCAEPGPAGEKSAATAAGIVDNYPSAPTIEENKGDRAAYYPMRDVVSMPPVDMFASMAGYYETLFHELVHSTGHPLRLKRKMMPAAAKGGAEYSREELVAEMGGAMLMHDCGMLDQTVENNAAYIQSWLNALNNNHAMVVWAAGQAEKAVRHIYGAEDAEHIA